jgi:hypothetical protein
MSRRISLGRAGTRRVAVKLEVNGEPRTNRGDEASRVIVGLRIFS